MLLTATLITRDEEQHLAECLASLVGVVDEIVVVDTGSTDATMSIAAAAGAIVAERPWNDDFASARNAALDLASGDWILSIDADERFRVEGDLRESLKDPNLLVGLVRFCIATRYTHFLEGRLFRHRPDLRFHGRMHETPRRDVRRIVAAEGKRVAPVPGAIDHLGYEGDQRAKHLRNRPLLEQAVRDDPQRSYLWFHLGIVRRELGDPRAAEQAWELGIAAARTRGWTLGPDVLCFVELALHRLSDGRSAADLVAEVTAAIGDEEPLAMWISAHQAMFEERWRDAIALIEPLRTIDPDEVLHPQLAYNRGLFGDEADHALGTCWFHLGDTATAAACFTRAEAADPHNVEYRVKRQLAEARASRG